MFLAHLTLEKIIKAHWVKDNAGDVPPKIHHLVKLVLRTNLNLDAGQLSLLQQINAFQMESRYPDFGFNLYKTLDEAFTKQLFEEVKILFQWLLNKLP